MLMENKRFKDDDPETCDVCNDWIWAGHRFFKWRTYTCCCIECVEHAMYEELEDEIEERHLLTAEDKKNRCADDYEDF